MSSSKSKMKQGSLYGWMNTHRVGGSALKGSITLIQISCFEILPMANFATKVDTNQQMPTTARSWECTCKMEENLSFHAFWTIPVHCPYTHRKYWTNWRSSEITPDCNPKDEILDLYSLGNYKLCFSIVNTTARNRMQSSMNHSVWMLVLFWKRNSHKQTADLPIRKCLHRGQWEKAKNQVFPD